MPPKNSKQTKATKAGVLAQQTVTTTTTTTTTTTSTATLAVSSTATTEVSTYVTDEDIQSVKTFVGNTLNSYKDTVNPIKQRATAVNTDDIREKVIDAIVDALFELTAKKRFPSFTRADLKMMADKLNKKLNE